MEPLNEGSASYYVQLIGLGLFAEVAILMSNILMIFPDYFSTRRSYLPFALDFMTLLKQWAELLH